MNGDSLRFIFPQFTNSDPTCTMTYRASTSSTSYNRKYALSEYAVIPTLPDNPYFFSVFRKLKTGWTFYIEATDNKPGTPNVYFFPTLLTLD